MKRGINKNSGAIR